MSETIIRVSEISQYVYCRRAWWMRRTAGYRPHNTTALAGGTDYHRRHASSVRQAGWLQRTALVLLFLAVAVVVFWLVQLQ
jgi:CRISPR/Cas system-associated exonuclease Cas4 (RecB family)